MVGKNTFWNNWLTVSHQLCIEVKIPRTLGRPLGHFPFKAIWNYQGSKCRTPGWVLVSRKDCLGLVVGGQDFTGVWFALHLPRFDKHICHNGNVDG